MSTRVVHTPPSLRGVTLLTCLPTPNPIIRTALLPSRGQVCLEVDFLVGWATGKGSLTNHLSMYLPTKLSPYNTLPPWNPWNGGIVFFMFESCRRRHIYVKVLLCWV
ncbi:unnamed protein product [Laminaria digitata]